MGILQRETQPEELAGSRTARCSVAVWGPTNSETIPAYITLLSSLSLFLGVLASEY